MIFSSFDYGIPEKGLVSSIIITYKQEELLFETIDSVLTQDYKSLEVIVADDATPGFDVERVEKYIQTHQKGNIVSALVLHNENNYGTVKNINNAIKKSKGEFIKIIAGDDCFSSSTVFSEQVGLLFDNPNKNVVIGWVQQCDRSMNPVDDARTQCSNNALSRILCSGSYGPARKIIKKENVFPISVQATCFRRAFFSKYGLCNEKYKLIEDTPLMFMILEHLDEAVELKKFSVLHRGELGLTTERGMFNPRREQYYLDNLNIIKDEIQKHPDIFTPIERIELPRLANIFYRLTRNNSEKKSILFSVGVVLSHVDAIIYYCINRILKE